MNAGMKSWCRRQQRNWKAALVHKRVAQGLLNLHAGSWTAGYSIIGKMELIIEGTIPRVPPFSLYDTWLVSCICTFLIGQYLLRFSFSAYRQDCQYNSPGCTLEEMETSNHKSDRFLCSLTWFHQPDRCSIGCYDFSRLHVQLLLSKRVSNYSIRFWRFDDYFVLLRPVAC